jgi:hypothetical protein
MDGFTLSASRVYLPTTFSASALAGLEVLRRAKAYRAREYCIPNNLLTPIPAYSQVEEQVHVEPGSYLWGVGFSIPGIPGNDTAYFGDIYSRVHWQVTDACTETALLSDYAFGFQAQQVTPATGQWNRRNPMILAQPVLVGAPGLLDVEIYNKAVTDNSGSPTTTGVDLFCQLILFFAEPSIPPERIETLLRQSGLLQREVV